MVTSVMAARKAASFSARVVVCAIRRPIMAITGKCSSVVQCCEVCVKRSQVTHASGTSMITAARSGMADQALAGVVVVLFQRYKVQAVAPPMASKRRTVRRRRMANVQRYRRCKSAFPRGTWPLHRSLWIRMSQAYDHAPYNNMTIDVGHRLSHVLKRIRGKRRRSIRTTPAPRSSAGNSCGGAHRARTG